jgi:hypothetical protein
VGRNIVQLFAPRSDLLLRLGEASDHVPLGRDFGARLVILISILIENPSSSF